jgi:pyruvate-formate lyase-activating enzyme
MINTGKGSVARNRSRWPLPEQVATWGDQAQFMDQRAESGQWVFWEERLNLVLNGHYHNVLPLHVEVSPTYLCNFACPWCSCRSAREEWSEQDVFAHPRSSPLTVMRQPRLEAVVDHLADHGVEIMWVGGEPTMNPLLYPAVARTAERGVAQCLFTNGSLVRRNHAQILFDAGLAFLRVSLNAVSSEVHRRHHDYDVRLPFGQRVLDNLTAMSQIRAEQRSPTQLGVSLVVDRENVDDLAETALFLARITQAKIRGKVDYVLVRPAFPMVGAHVELSADVVEKYLDSIEPASSFRRTLVDAGIPVVLPDSSRATGQPLPEDGRGCLAAGWFGEVSPSGDMLPCSDLYGEAYSGEFRVFCSACRRE